VSATEITRILLYNVPGFLLIIALLFRDFSPPEAGFPRPGRKDALTAALVFISLVVLAALLSGAAKLFTGFQNLPIPEAPRGIAQWLVMLSAAVTTAYLEEAYFRAYVLTRLSHAGITVLPRVLVSVGLFSLCHLYEGAWGIANAGLAGLLLAVVYERRQSVHGIAWAHAAYNALVYAAGI